MCKLISLRVVRHAAFVRAVERRLYFYFSNSSIKMVATRAHAEWVDSDKTVFRLWVGFNCVFIFWRK